MDTCDIILQIVDGVSLVLAIIFCAIAIAEPNWRAAYIGGPENKVNEGLWKSCSKTECIQIDAGKIGSWFVAVRVLTCIALVGFILVGITFLLRLLHNKIPIREGVAELIHQVTAFLTGFIALCAAGTYQIRCDYDDKLYDDYIYTANIDYCAYLMYVAWLLGILAAAAGRVHQRTIRSYRELQ